MPEPTQDDGFEEFERQLTAFSPRASTLDRSALLFRAGQESMRGRERRNYLAQCVWPIATAFFAGFSVTLYWQQHKEPQVVERIRYVQSPPAVESVNEANAGAALRPPTISPPTAAPGIEFHAPRRDVAASRNHYLNRRQLALTLGLDVLNGPISDGGGHGGGPRSYREMKANLLNIQRALENNENSNSSGRGAHFGDNT